jgi:UDP-3-O-[3-hydroxymyristoyl] glucosamine N-acyltransferase
MPALAGASPRSLREIAAAIGAELVGDGSPVMRAVAHPAMASGPDVLALAMDEGSEKALGRTKSIAAVVGEGRVEALKAFKGGMVVKRPRYALAQLLDLFGAPPAIEPGVHAKACVHATASIGEDVAIGPFVEVGPRARIGAGCQILSHASIGADAVLGRNCLVHAGARIGDRCVLGERVIVQPNAVIGGDGFSFVTPTKGSIESAEETGGTIEAQNTEIVRINSIGNVVIGDDCEIGAGTCVDRGTLGPTRIGRGTKIDNLVQIGHNCSIGEKCLIAGMTGLAGSVTLGNRVVLASSVGIADHLTVGDDAIVLARAAVGRNIPAREVWGGYPAGRWTDFKNILINLPRIGRLVREIEELKTQIRKIDTGRPRNGAAGKT